MRINTRALLCCRECGQGGRGGRSAASRAPAACASKLRVWGGQGLACQGLFGEEGAGELKDLCELQWRTGCLHRRAAWGALCVAVLSAGISVRPSSAHGWWLREAAQACQGCASCVAGRKLCASRALGSSLLCLAVGPWRLPTCVFFCVCCVCVLRVCHRPGLHPYWGACAR